MELDLAAVLPHLTERGRLEFDLAVQKATNQRLLARVGELEALLDAMTAPTETQR